MANDSYRDTLRRLLAGRDLSRREAHAAFGQIMDGRWAEAQIAGLLVGLAAKGETVDEIAGAAEAMREHAVTIDTAGHDVIDIVGTGGTGLRTFNVSTTASFVCAGAGLKVAKHGNRTNTRASGSADVLAALGVNLEAPPELVKRCLDEAGMCFCFAVKHHPAMKYAAGVRKALGVRTIFNILGPLTNPAGAKRQLMGIFSADLTETIAHVLGALGLVRAMVVHAADGLDEISTTAETKVSELKDGRVETRSVKPEDFGLPRAKFEDLLVDSPEQSAAVVRGVLAGNSGAPRDLAVLNAAAALTIAERAASILEAIPLAERSIDSGAARAVLDKLAALSHA